jgi:UDP-N-acetylmuramoyl-L-alanyl-D-glutamate--2,6-diaminopimelate ligase
MKIKLSQIKEIIEGAIVLFNGREIDVTSICYDSRQVTDGALFVAIKGEKTDGHQFVHDAFKRGAIALVTQRKIDTAVNLPQIIVPDSRLVLSMLSHKFYNNPSEKIKVIGITGTTGKTTVAYLIRAILEAAGNKVGMLGTISYSIGTREIPALMTTPESYEIAGYLAEMASQGLGYAVMEVSSHSLVQNRVHDIKFASAVFTNLGRDHLDFHKTVEGYRNAKSILFRKLSSESKAVLNDDDSSSVYFESLTKAKVLKYGLKGKSEFNAEIKSSSLEGLSLIIHTPEDKFEIKSSLIGRHNAYNILSAVTATYSVGVKDSHVIAKGVESVKSVRGRLEIVETKKPFKVLVDFAHTPDALEKSLESLKGLVKGKLIVVFGCGGDRDKGKRPLMGKAVENYADIMVLTSDNPRSEEPEAIIKDIEKGLTGKTKYEVEPDRRKAIEKALNMAKSGDLILIAGKGHETYQIFKDTVKPFDDREVVQEILGLRSNSPADKFARIKMLL